MAGLIAALSDALLIVAYHAVHEQSDFFTNEVLICRGPQRWQAVEQQLDSLRFKLVHHEDKKELKILVAECIACRLGAVDVYKTTSVWVRGMI